MSLEQKFRDKPNRMTAIETTNPLESDYSLNRIPVKYLFKGHDGRDYPTMDGLVAANEKWRRRNLVYNHRRRENLVYKMKKW